MKISELKSKKIKEDKEYDKESKEILAYAMKHDHEILEKIKQYIYDARLTVSYAQNVTGLIAKDDEYVKGGNFVLQCIENIIYEKPYVDDDEDDV